MSLREQAGTVAAVAIRPGSGALQSRSSWCTEAAMNGGFQSLP